MKKKLLVISGPTAVGKTDLSIDIAKAINGEIISADSMQIYRYMDIGSAKVTLEEMKGIKHHMIDVVTPDMSFSVSDYQKLAKESMNDIFSRGKVPIIVGGTGLYINSLTCNMNFTEAEKDDEYREYLECVSKQKGNIYLHNMLKDIDPISYENIHPNNIKKVIRALEVYKITGRPFSSYDLGENIYNSEFDVYYYVLTMNREELYSRINKRVDIMMEKGLLKECIKLQKMGYNSTMQSMQGIGYKEILYYLENKMTLEDAIFQIKKGSRNYAKRQLTWFRRDKRIKYLDKDIMTDDEIKSLITNEFLQA